MSSKYVYYCDRCKKEIEKEEDQIKVEIGLQYNNNSKNTSYRNYYSRNAKMDLCKDCAEALGVTLKQAEELAQYANSETTESKLYSLIVDIVADVVENR